MISDDQPEPREPGRARFSLSSDSRSIIARTKDGGGFSFDLSDRADAAAVVTLLNGLDIFSDRLADLLNGRENQVEGYIRRNIKAERVFRRHYSAVAEAVSFYRDSGLALKSARAAEVFNLLLATLDDLEAALTSQQNEKTDQPPS